MMEASAPSSSPSFSEGTTVNGDEEEASVPAKEEEELDEVQVHDQLPSVEEVRNNAALALAYAEGSHGQTRQQLRQLMSSPKKQYMKYIFYGGIVLLCISMTLLIVGLVQRSFNNSSKPLTIPDVHEYLFLQGITSSEDLTNVASPQYAAIDWLVHRDEASVPVPDISTSSPRNHLHFLQRYALTVLYYATKGPGWLDRWNMVTSVHTCFWHQRIPSNTDGRYYDLGASCDVSGIVDRIHIPQTELEGSLPSELSVLTDLVFLALNHNSLTGTIPTEFVKLTQLDYLALQYNKLEGTIPSFLGTLTKLRVLGLGDNTRFSGSIPDSFLQLTNLVTLGLDDNALTGDLSNLRNMTNLKRLFLDSNGFHQTLDDNLSQLNKLEELDLSDNLFSGTLPVSLFSNFPNLFILDLHRNALEGSLPLDLPYNNRLKFLALQENSLRGPILEALNRFTNVTHLDLANNDFTGSIPPQLTDQMTQLQYLFLANNPQLAPGPISDVVNSKLSNLVDLSLKHSQRTGSIPVSVATLENLVLLDLDHNALTGTLPSSLALLTKLQYLLVNRNEGLTGQIPDRIQGLPELKIFLASQTSLRGNLNNMCARSASANNTLLGGPCAGSASCPKPVTVISADCDGEFPEIICPCCNVCCSDGGDEVCRDDVYYGSLDPTWENSYERKYYQFNPEMIFGSGT